MEIISRPSNVGNELDFEQRSGSRITSCTFVCRLKIEHQPNALFSSAKYHIWDECCNNYNASMGSKSTIAAPLPEQKMVANVSNGQWPCGAWPLNNIQNDLNNLACNLDFVPFNKLHERPSLSMSRLMAMAVWVRINLNRIHLRLFNDIVLAIMLVVPFHFPHFTSSLHLYTHCQSTVVTWNYQSIRILERFKLLQLTICCYRNSTMVSTTVCASSSSA